MADRLAVITGAAGGIGRATVELFAEHGWTVVGVDRTNGGEGAVEWFTIDLADEHAVAAAFSEIERFGTIHALVNNAAVSARRPMKDTTPANWDSLMAVNLRGPFVVIREAAPRMARPGGSIINVSSVHAIATTADAAAYATSKSGLLGLTRAAALELGKDGIRVNAVIPGAIDTPMLYGTEADPGRVGKIAHRTPLGRIGSPSDVAEAVLFLADSNRSSFITGQTLAVDGGALARLSTE